MFKSDKIREGLILRISRKEKNGKIKNLAKLLL